MQEMVYLFECRYARFMTKKKHLKNGNKSQTIQILNQNKLKDSHFICMYQAV